MKVLSCRKPIIARVVWGKRKNKEVLPAMVVFGTRVGAKEKRGEDDVFGWGRPGEAGGRERVRRIRLGTMLCA